MKKFEYKVLNAQAKFMWNGQVINDCEKWVNAIGLDGWELTCVYNMFFFFKREIV